MYAYFMARENMFEKGIFHVRRDGKVVKELKKEDADFVEKQEEVQDRVAYHFFFEAKKGDKIKSSPYGSEVVTLLKELEVQHMSMLIKDMCTSLIKQKKEISKKIEGVLKEILPMVFADDMDYYGGDAPYLKKYLDIFEYIGKPLNEYVPQVEIDEYISFMITSYRLSIVEEFLNRKTNLVSEFNQCRLKEAKKNLNDTIEQLKEVARQQNNVAFSHEKRGVVIEKDTPCGKVTCVIREFGKIYTVWLYLKNLKQKPYYSTVLLIPEKCKEFESLYRKYEDSYREYKKIFG